MAIEYDIALRSVAVYLAQPPFVDFSTGIVGISGGGIKRLICVAIPTGIENVAVGHHSRRKRHCFMRAYIPGVRSIDVHHPYLH